MTEVITLISHPCRAWPKCRNLHIASDGWLLTIARDPLRDGARRLIEEGYDPASALVIKDAADSAPDLRSASLAEAAKPEATKR